jgi:hypothetical protein
MGVYGPMNYIDISEIKSRLLRWREIAFRLSHKKIGSYQCYLLSEKAISQEFYFYLEYLLYIRINKIFSILYLLHFFKGKNGPCTSLFSFIRV